ncbi:hypothetical protein O181_079386 [Austropuccinia psidii MF-1]|uniref:Uncharacterized protein n=1 Tax=Austropuccinia psidii MF-1 TaxID=1389203 RepID=A0A9Q3FG58_9BASI|nr:hypothetical protein [Austropuccinia psidii MF-1]
MSPHHPPDETPALPSISVLNTPYAFTPPPLPSLCSRGELPTSLILRLPKVPSQYAPDTTYPYTCVVPSRHPPDNTHPYACVVPSRHAPDTSYHPHARGAPS